MHNWKLEAAAKNIAEAIETLDSDAFEYAKEALWQSTPEVISTLFTDDGNGLCLNLTGVDWKVADGESPLTIQIYDLGESKLLHCYDPITFVTEDPPSEYGAEKAARAIAALQSGIDRLRAYEAECLKAQP